MGDQQNGFFKKHAYNIFMSIYVFICAVVLIIGSCYFQFKGYDLVKEHKAQIKKAFDQKDEYLFIDVTEDIAKIQNSEFVKSREGIGLKWVISFAVLLLAFGGIYVIPPRFWRGVLFLALVCIATCISLYLKPKVVMNPVVLLGILWHGGVIWIMDAIHSAKFKDNLKEAGDDTDMKKLLYDTNIQIIKYVVAAGITLIAVITWNTNIRNNQVYIFGPLVNLFTVWTIVVAAVGTVPFAGLCLGTAAHRICKILETGGSNKKKLEIEKLEEEIRKLKSKNPTESSTE